VTAILFAAVGSAVFSASGLALPAMPPLGVMPQFITPPSFDGSGNNTGNPAWGQADTPLVRLMAADYGDGLSAPAGAGRPSTRVVSNTVSAQSGFIPNTAGASSLLWGWGQFLAHDIALTPAGSAEAFNIPVPSGDFGGAITEIPVERSVFDAATGQTNPRQQVNTISAYIDGSMVYGSSASAAAALRTDNGQGSRLLTGGGGMLVMEDGQFVAGDVRATEHAMLSSFHTLFVREHNRLAAAIEAASPGLSAETVYQMARRVVVGELQSITYNEYLPVLLGETHGLPAYSAYDATQNAGIANEFSSAAFRLGHTLLAETIRFEDVDGQVTELPLDQCFFNPDCLLDNGVGGTLRGMVGQAAQEIDEKVTDAVRNRLITGAGVTVGVDLPAINMQRGRDHGLPGYGDALAAFGLGDTTIADSLEADLLALYGTLAEVDLFIGGLAEAHLADAMVGPLFHHILSDQFLRLRDGDRFFYQNTALFDPAFTGWLDGVTLDDVVRWNTDFDPAEDAELFYLNGVRPQAVPVPASAALLGSLCVLAGWQARRKGAGQRNAVAGSPA
jgi:hypothetical protein